MSKYFGCVPICQFKKQLIWGWRLQQIGATQCTCVCYYCLELYLEHCKIVLGHMTLVRLGLTGPMVASLRSPDSLSFYLTPQTSSVRL